MIMKRGNKRAISPIIATVLLIALVFVLTAIIFLWAKGFISEQIEKFGQPVESICEDVSFDVQLVNREIAGYELEIANRGNVAIYNFDIKGIVGGDSQIKTFKFSVDVGESIRESVNFDFDREPEEIVVFPRILGSVKGKQINRAFTCVDKGKTINL